MALTDTFYFMGDFSFASDSTSEEIIYTSQLFKSTTTGYTTYVRTSFDITADASTTYTIKIYIKSVSSSSWGTAIKTISLSGSQTNYTDITSVSTLADGGKDIKLTIQTSGNMVTVEKLLSQVYKT